MQDETVTFVRHGQTDWNVKAMMMGAADHPLNDPGMKQARNLAEKICKKQFDIILSSPLKRAWSTASIIANHHTEKPPLKELHDLKELDTGSFTGRPRSSFSTTDWMKDQLEGFDGESYISFKARLTRLCQFLGNSTHQHILLVSHGKVFACLSDMLNLSQKRLGNCEYLTFPKSKL